MTRIAVALCLAVCLVGCRSVTSAVAPRQELSTSSLQQRTSVDLEGPPNILALSGFATKHDVVITARLESQPINAWNFQILIDTDQRPGTGYGHQYEYLVNGIDAPLRRSTVAGVYYVAEGGWAFPEFRTGFARV